MQRRKKILVTGFGIVQMSLMVSSSAFCKRVDEALLDKAGSTGSVRVIARLNVDYETEGKLSSTASVEKQRAGIAQKQKNLLGRISAHK